VISIIIPTLGRDSLSAALFSLKAQLDPEDEVIVVGDGPQHAARNIAKSFGAFYKETKPTREWGHAQRNLGMEMARGEYLSFMDDDDFYLSGALQAMRKAIHEHPGKPFLFKIHDGDQVIWQDPVPRFSNVSSQMVLFPNVKEKLGVWQKNAYTSDGRGGDFRFIMDTLSRYAPADLVFRPEIIARISKHSGGM